jgi:CheY-like chemotaxis protein
MAKSQWMIVEDDELLRMMLSAMLEYWNTDGLMFQDGFAAMSWLDAVEKGSIKELPELALLDMRMPGPQGHQIAARLRKIGTTSKIAIVIMTAYRLSQQELDEIAALAWPEKIIAKPLPEMDALESLLKGIIHQAKDKAAATPGTPSSSTPQTDITANESSQSTVAPPAAVSSPALSPSPSPSESEAPKSQT